MIWYDVIKYDMVQCNRIQYNISTGQSRISYNACTGKFGTILYVYVCLCWIILCDMIWMIGICIRYPPLQKP